MGCYLCGDSPHTVRGALPWGETFHLSVQGHMSVPTVVALGSPGFTKILGQEAFLRHQPSGASQRRT